MTELPTGTGATTWSVPAPAEASISRRASVFSDQSSLDFADACAAAAAGLQYVDGRRLWNGFSHEIDRSR
jgi:hypothetical protein